MEVEIILTSFPQTSVLQRYRKNLSLITLKAVDIWLSLYYTYSNGGNFVFRVSQTRSRVTLNYFSLTVTLLLMYSPYFLFMTWHMYILSLLVLFFTSPLERLEITIYLACLTIRSGDTALQDQCAGQSFHHGKYDFERRRHKYMHVCMSVCAVSLTEWQTMLTFIIVKLSGEEQLFLMCCFFCVSWLTGNIDSSSLWCNISCSKQACTLTSRVWKKERNFHSEVTLLHVKQKKNNLKGIFFEMFMIKKLILMCVQWF